MDEAQRAELIQQAVEGNGDALQRLILLYHQPLRATVDRRLDAGLDRYFDADDVLQQAYVAAFKGVGDCGFAHPAAFYAWLERIALNKLESLRRDLRRQKRDIGRRVDAGSATETRYPDLAERFESPESTPSRKLARGEAAAAVLTSLARLSEDQRNVIRLRLLEGLPVPEVAQALGKSEGAVHSLTHRALKELRRLMASATQFLYAA